MAIHDVLTPDYARNMLIDGLWLHRISYMGGQGAYVMALPLGFTDGIFISVDMSDPTNPTSIST
jgi:hypothetical protein